jgi:ABC-type antimicrobial peptide transport system permease subunit
MALGAARYDVFRLVLSHGALLICIGIVLGLIGAIAASHVLQAVLYNVGALDLPAFAIAIGALAFIALFACFLPARRASRVDPIVALRED